MAERRYQRVKRVQRSISRPKTRAVLKRRGLTIGLTALGALFLFSAGTVLWWSKDLPSPDSLNNRSVLESTKIFDRTGEHLLYEIGDIHRTAVPLDNVSRFVKQATLAAEDDQFYEHNGIDILGIARGVILKPLTGQRAQGGSTITQQLIKNSILTSERTVQRKVKEAVLALELEQRFSKDEILEMYLNDIPYGSQAYGIEAAANTFFEKSAADLSLAEAAVLAGLPKAPTYYSPYGSHVEDMKARQEHILGRMQDLEMITPEQAETAKAEELAFVQRRESIQAPHFVFYVKELLDEELGSGVIDQGAVNIYTTLDIDMQRAAEEALSENAENLNGLGGSNAAITAIDPKTGDILAMAGSLDYFNEEIDGNVNVAIRHRSPGSSIKPFVYAAAFAKGYTPETILIDAETDFGKEYKPKNYDLKEYGPVTMRQALANSLNIPAVKALYLVGVNEATELAQRMGMTSLDDPDRYGLSLVLGGGEVRLVDEVSAYGVFANDGKHVDHRAVLRVERGDEEIINITEDEPEEEEVLSTQVARQVVSVLSDNAARALSFGTRSFLTLGSRPVAAKTGTTQEYRDGWTVGFTPSLAAGVWTGNNDNTPMGGRAAGANTAAPIWNAFMRKALEGKPIENFTPPEPLKDVRYPVLRGEMNKLKAKWDRTTGNIFDLNCPVNLGQPKTFKEIHNILFYVRKDSPNEQPPARAEADPQFARWEEAVQIWKDKHNTETKDNFEEVRYVTSLPTPSCGVSSSEDLPKVSIVEPESSIATESPIRVRVEIDDKGKSIKEVRYLWDGQEAATKRADENQEINFTFDQSFSGRKTLVVQAVTEDNLVGQASRNFTINPDGSAPAVSLLTPKANEVITSGNFPYTVKVTASDDSGIELVDVLYTKEGQEGTSRIGRTSSPHPTIANRYEFTWPDSAGPGVYKIYAVAYDKTGNTSETSKHSVVVE